MTPDSLHQRTLSDGWLLQSSTTVGSARNEVASPGFDAADWLPATMPSTILATLVASGQYEDPYFGMNLKQIATESFQETWWCRTEFSLSNKEAGKVVLLEFEGINYAADIWLNGRLIATADEAKGAFRRFQFDISDAIVAGANVLAVEVAGPKPGDFSTGFVDWNPPPPDGNMGLFRPVRLRFCDGVSIENPFVRTDLNVETLAEADLTVLVDLVNHSDEPVSGVIEGQIEAVHFRKAVHLEPQEKKTVAFTAGDHQELRFTDPRLWWPYELGEPELYQLDIRFVSCEQISDRRSIRFGIRDVADYWTSEGHRGFKINGHEVLIKGAGWTDDLLLADTYEGIEAQLRYVKHMNLNCVRCEGIWGTDQTLYDLCDGYGILMMVGWSCHWEHEQYLGKPVDERYGGITSPEDIDLVSRSWEDQPLWLRHHPSIFVCAVASDKVPAPDLERRYIETFRKYDPTRPYLASTGGFGSEQQIIGNEEIVSEVSGDSGVKMLGPYAYTPPVYWYTDTQRGGAYGFNTETCPGAVVPTLESLRKMIPAEKTVARRSCLVSRATSDERRATVWPIDEYWDFHCGLNEFDTLDRYREAIRHRYGEAEGLEEFARKAQVLNYELMRPMFEAFRVNRDRATGVVQWMLNAAWPKMYWQLYDWYLMPTGAFYAARSACASPQLIYHYGDRGIYLVNDRNAEFRGLRAEIRLYDIDSRLYLSAHLPVEAKRESSEKVFALPPFESISTAHFLSLRLTDGNSSLVARRLSPEIRDTSDERRVSVANNFYWLSTKPDVLDYDAKVEPWEFYTPCKAYADLTMLETLATAEIGIKFRDSSPERRATSDERRVSVTVELENLGDRIAFSVELVLLDKAGEPVVPVFWQDNFISLLPHEKRTLSGGFPRSIEGPVLMVRGWNIEERRSALTR